MFNGEKICHLKRRLKRLCYYKRMQVNGLIHIIVELMTKNICAHFYHPPVILLRRAPLNIAIGHQVLCSNKGTNLKFIFSWRKINWQVLQTAKAHFSYSTWLIISEKSIMLWHTRFFTMVVHPCTKSLSKQGMQKNCLQEFPILLALNYYVHVCMWFL